MKIKIFCHTCEGLGVIEEDGYPDHRKIKVVCPECDGYGWVEKEASK
jgi:DnaJ-class molecular chaperone